METTKKISLILSSSTIYEEQCAVDCTPEAGVPKEIGNAHPLSKDDLYYVKEHAIVEWNTEQNSFYISNRSNFGTYYRVEKNHLARIQYGQFILIGEKTNIVFNKCTHQGATLYIISIMDIDSNLHGKYALTSKSTVIIGRYEESAPNANTIDIKNDHACSRRHIVATLLDDYVIIKDWAGPGIGSVEKDGNGSVSGTWISIVGSIPLKNNMQVRMGKSVFGKFVIS